MQIKKTKGADQPRPWYNVLLALAVRCIQIKSRVQGTHGQLQVLLFDHH